MIRIGMLTPSSNTCLEPLSQEMTAGRSDLSVHFTRLPVTTLGLAEAETAQFQVSTMVAAAELLADAGMDVIAWNGTSGSWLGLDLDRRIAGAISSATGAIATTSTLAFFDAFATLKIRRFGLVVPYTADLTAQIVDVYAREGMECVAERHLDLRENTAVGAVPEQRVAEMLGEVAVPGADVLAVVCTNLWGGRIAPQVERQTGVPVLDSVAVTLWHALQLADVDTGDLATWGQIFSSRIADPRTATS